MKCDMHGRLDLLLICHYYSGYDKGPKTSNPEAVVFYLAQIFSLPICIGRFVEFAIISWWPHIDQFTTKLPVII